MQIPHAFKKKKKKDLLTRRIKQYPSPVICECKLIIPLTAELTLLKQWK